MTRRPPQAVAVACVAGLILSAWPWVAGATESGSPRPESVGDQRAARARDNGDLPGGPHKMWGRDRPHRRHILKGRVTAVGDSKFTLQTRRATLEVAYNQQTKFRGGSSSDIKVGARVVVLPLRPFGPKPRVGAPRKVVAKVVGFPRASDERGTKRPRPRKTRVAV